MNTPDIARVRADFDQIATFGESGSDRYDGFLLSRVPVAARRVLEVGCGLGRLCAMLAKPERHVCGLDLSSVMVQRATLNSSSPGVSFVEGDFNTYDFADARFDCIVSAAAVHHMPLEPTVARMAGLLAPGGTLVIHDMRRDAGLVDSLRAYVTLVHHVLVRFSRTGRLRPPLHVRAAWVRHGHDEHYLSFAEARQVAARLLPGSQVFYHSMWRYTIVWHKP